MGKKPGRRLALIIGAEDSDWISCKSITPNLVAAYQKAFGASIRIFGQKTDCSSYQHLRLANEIFKYQPDQIIFVDHKPHPEPLISAMVESWQGFGLPPITVHLYGDFTLYTQNWWRLVKNYPNLRLRFFCASFAQVELVNGLMAPTALRAQRVPFPVKTTDFSYSEKQRLLDRKYWNITDDEFVFIYSGRMSVQKNPIRLLHEFAKIAKQSPRPIRLVIAGPFDDIGAPFFGVRSEAGTYSMHWQQAMNALDPQIRRRVHYLGSLDTKALASLYRAADCYASLSLYHDEDFGMAPVEAMLCGCPALLTAWGGFKSFVEVGEDVAMIPVHMERTGLAISAEQVKKLMLKQINKQRNAQNRQQLSKAAQSYYSIEAVASGLEQLCAQKIPPFVGFNKVMAMQMQIVGSADGFMKNPSTKSLYQRIYYPYYS